MNIMQIIIAKIDVPETLFLNVVVRDANVDNVTALTMNSLEKISRKRIRIEEFQYFMRWNFLTAQSLLFFRRRDDFLPPHSIYHSLNGFYREVELLDC